MCIKKFYETLDNLEVIDLEVIEFFIDDIEKELNLLSILNGNNLSIIVGENYAFEDSTNKNRREFEKLQQFNIFNEKIYNYFNDLNINININFEWEMAEGSYLYYSASITNWSKIKEKFEKSNKIKDFNV